MEPNRKVRNTALTPEQLAEARDTVLADAQAVALAWEGRFDARIAELREQAELVAAGRFIEELQKQAAVVQADIASAIASRDAILAEGATAKASAKAALDDAARALEAAQVSLSETRQAAATVAAQASADVARIKAAGEEEIRSLRDEARAARDELAETRAEVKTAQGELAAFQQRLADEKRLAAERLGIA